ncbi:uncharacterized protein LOC120111450 [Phoenix dactylifera]|uniref:Uncharacterized protein LOC120111450 n=1 Tax=Phoenix dactylifera TaxID=42345 RepID=A0A8B9AF73_PHODC|nr:uncharacterized protein LOC120111450 [Phoenix dactylifera]
MCQGEYGTFLPVDTPDPLEHAHHLKTQLKSYGDSKCYCMAIATLEDARSLKSLADRLKALEVDISKIHLDGALTFLKGASLLEDCIIQGERPRDTNNVFHHYRDAARLFRSLFDLAMSIV